MNVIVWLDFELAYYEVAVPHVSHYTAKTLLPNENKSSYHIHPTPPLGQDMAQSQFLKQGLTGLNSEFSFS